MGLFRLGVVIMARRHCNRFKFGLTFKNKENVEVKLLLYQIGGLMTKNCRKVVDPIEFKIRSPLTQKLALHSLPDSIINLI